MNPSPGMACGPERGWEYSGLSVAGPAAPTVWTLCQRRWTAASSGTCHGAIGAFITPGLDVFRHAMGLYARRNSI
ncbi:hypothetical protein FHS20_001444 [Phyllobacterium endophyticum]|nr:hypothetical protein [Phyllobacterium endophyticum]